jgi:hypothetical protein
MKKIIALTDYKGHFGSKHFDKPYRSGMDKNVLRNCFNESGYDIEFVQFTELINLTNIPTDCHYIYTSSEDQKYLYKSFIEDQILFLQEYGCKVIPEYKYLRANNNKVFMELLRNSSNCKELSSIHSKIYGTYEESIKEVESVEFPVVIKTAEGAGGSGVFQASNISEYKKIIRKVAASKNLYYDIKEIGRTKKHKGYIKESSFRKKFIVQIMIRGLKNDWKVLVFGSRSYVLYRGVRTDDFRASGSGNFKFQNELPEGMLDFAYAVKEHFEVPNISLDIAFDGSNFHVLEFQFLFFGTSTLEKSPFFFEKNNGVWLIKEETSVLECVYVKSITDHINRLEKK